MEHNLYVKFETIVNKLANDKKCIVTNLENYKKNKKFLAPYEIEYGQNKGKMEYYDLDCLIDSDVEKLFIRILGILPRASFEKVSQGAHSSKYPGIDLNTLLSDKPCSKEETERQKSVIMKFFHMTSFSLGSKRFCYALY